MAFIFFSCINPAGQSGEYSYGGLDMKACFETLNCLTAAGWTLTHIRLVEPPGSSGVALPVEAFTGEPMEEDLMQLQLAWETALAQPCSNSKERSQQCLIRTQVITSVVHHAWQIQKRANQQAEERSGRIENLFKKVDNLLESIEETKAKWGVE